MFLRLRRQGYLPLHMHNVYVVHTCQAVLLYVCTCMCIYEHECLPAHCIGMSIYVYIYILYMYVKCNIYIYVYTHTILLYYYYYIQTYVTCIYICHVHLMILCRPILNPFLSVSKA